MLTVCVRLVKEDAVNICSNAIPDYRVCTVGIDRGP